MHILFCNNYNHMAELERRINRKMLIPLMHGITLYFSPKNMNPDLRLQEMGTTLKYPTV